ncbi:MAG: FecR family protein [Chitinophagaceae bacterium]|nr:FecR family protein [Chitinophagaceae bacterium]
MVQNLRLQYLFQQYAARAHNAEEKEELFALISMPEHEGDVMQLIAETWNTEFPVYQQNANKAEEIFKYIVAQENKKTSDSVIHRIPILSKDEPLPSSDIDHRNPTRVFMLRWLKYAAAILIIAGLGTYLWNNSKQTKTSSNSNKPLVAAFEKILPGKEKALLTLADGSIIELDSAANGQLTTQGNSRVIKKDGIITYSETVKNEGVIAYSEGQPIPSHGGVVSPNGETGVGSVQRPATNTMSTPRGGQYQLTLPDNTKVWLNASSSITYPVVFNEKTRTVSITGEAYFQITANARQPFIVKTKSEEITVLGTEFNVNSYNDEPISKTSLVSGSVRVSINPPVDLRSPQTSATPFSKGGGYTLRPGQAFSNGKITTTNISNDIAWKNGYFSFTDADIKTVMRQLSRWYDIDVKYSGAIPTDEFNGKIGRDLTLSQVLKILSKTRINYRIENKTIIVLP